MTVEELFTFLKDKNKSDFYKNLEDKRKSAINKYFWCKEKGYFFDYTIKGKRTNIMSLAGLYPLFFNIADKEKADN